METSIDIDQLVNEYRDQRARFEEVVTEVQFVLRGKLPSFAITGRTKEPDSLREKIERKQYESLRDVTDLAAVRVVCSYEDELDEVGAIVRNEFTIQHVTDKSNELGIDRMGYRGTSYNVVLGKQYSGARYNAIRDLVCEIQVRTILQDAWAQIEHGLVYKSKQAVPDRLRRDILNVASLLEIAQRVFDNVRDARRAYEREIQGKSKHPSDFLSQALDWDTLAAYTRWKYPKLDISERIQTILLSDIDKAKYPTLRELDAAIDAAKPAIDRFAVDNPDLFQAGTDFITKSLGFVDLMFRRRHQFGTRSRKAFDVLGKRVKSSE